MPVGYGKKIRDAVVNMKKKAHQRYRCPSCSRMAIRREASGVWKCRKCSVKFASGAYGFKL